MSVSSMHPTPRSGHAMILTRLLLVGGRCFSNGRGVAAASIATASIEAYRGRCRLRSGVHFCNNIHMTTPLFSPSRCAGISAHRRKCRASVGAWILDAAAAEYPKGRNCCPAFNALSRKVNPRESKYDLSVIDAFTCLFLPSSFKS